MSDTPDVYDMVASYLIDNGFDGLYNENGECACTVDDLSPAACMSYECVAGYYHKGCTEDCGNGCSFHIMPFHKKDSL